VGEGTKVVRLAAALLALLALGALYHLREYRSFGSAEAMDLAQVAANLADGRGYTTDFVRPFSVYLLQQQAAAQGKDPNAVLALPHPDIANAPLYPALLALAMKALPLRYDIAPGGNFTRYLPEVIIALLNQALFLVGIGVVFLLARRLFDEPVAWLAAIVFAGSDALWRFSISGTPTLLLVNLFVALVFCLVVLEQGTREPERSTGWWVRWACLAGLVLGAGTLTRYAFGWLVLPVLGFTLLYLGQQRVRVAVLLLLVFLAVVAPWIVRNHHISGRLFGTAGYAAVEATEAFPANRLMRSVQPALQKVEFDHFLRKLVVNGGDWLGNGLPTLGGTWVVAFFLPSLLIPFRNPALARLRVFLLMVLVTLLPVQALGQTNLLTETRGLTSEHYLIWLLPAVVIFGVGMYFLLLDQLDLSPPPLRTLAHTAFCGLSCSALLVTLLPPRQPPQAYPPYWPPLVQQLAGWMRPGELMMSDIPWAVAWYGRRPCLWAVLDVEDDFMPLNDFQKPIQAVYLTQATTDTRFFSGVYQNPDKHSWEWFMVQGLLRTNIPPRFPLRISRRDFPEGQLYLTDYERWERR
jgi:hypothetical protein